jgi:hypothetical protein
MSSKKFTPGQLCVVKGRTEDDFSYAIFLKVAAPNEASSVLLVHPNEHLAGQYDLVLSSDLTSAGIPLVVQCASVVTVLDGDIEPAPYNLARNVLPEISTVFRTGDLNTDELWTGLPLRGQLDHRWSFSVEQAELGDRLAAPYLELAGCELLLDPSLVDLERVAANGVNVRRAISAVLNAPSRAITPDVMIQLNRGEVQLTDQENSFFQMMEDFVALEAISHGVSPSPKKVTVTIPEFSNHFANDQLLLV